MFDRRENSRRKARERRAAAKGEALARARNNCQLAANAIEKATSIVAEPDFKQFLLSRNIQSMPECIALVAEDDTKVNQSGASSAEATLEHISLQFAVAWKFLYPLLGDAEIEAYLETVHPSFIPELKDAFIALVTHGPFPNAMGGHRGRKHQANYHPRNIADRISD